MIIHACLRSSSWKINPKVLKFSNIYIAWLKHNSLPIFGYYALIRLLIISILFWGLSTDTRNNSSKLVCWHTTTKWCFWVKNRHPWDCSFIVVYHKWSRWCNLNSHLSNKSDALQGTYLQNSNPNILWILPFIFLIHDSLIKVFGCSSFVHIHSHNHGKLEPRSIKCVFLGYSPNQKGYKCCFLATKK